MPFRQLLRHLRMSSEAKSKWTKAKKLTWCKQCQGPIPAGRLYFAYHPGQRTKVNLCGECAYMESRVGPVVVEKVKWYTSLDSRSLTSGYWGAGHI